jgi:diguanylate cyclase (GGDEF)-like protein
MEKTPTGDISWLFEPHTQTLFMQFPLPFAVIGHDGQVRQLNDCFNKSFGTACLSQENLQKIFQGAYDGPDKFVLVRCGSDNREVFVRAVRVSDCTVLVMDASLASPHKDELETLHKRLFELEKISVSDSLTGAWNRTHFDRIISVELARSLRYKQPVSLLFLDIDHFKQVNDTFGHLAGDQVLCELVNVVGANIRASDMLFRWGGEEFVILVTSTTYGAAGVLAESLRSKMAGHVIEGVGRITISLGVAEYLSGGK